MYNIIHMQIPMSEEGKYLVTLTDARKFIQLCKEILGNKYKIITTPFYVNEIKGNNKIINIDCKPYSYNELMEIIEKAEMYDDLCK